VRFIRGQDHPAEEGEDELDLEDRVVGGLAELSDGAHGLLLGPLVRPGVALVEIEDLLDVASRAHEFAGAALGLQIPFGLDQERHRSAVDGLDSGEVESDRFRHLRGDPRLELLPQRGGVDEGERAGEAHLDGAFGLHHFDVEGWSSGGLVTRAHRGGSIGRTVDEGLLREFMKEPDRR
jgi:hypothetical protein